MEAKNSDSRESSSEQNDLRSGTTVLCKLGEMCEESADSALVEVELIKICLLFFSLQVHHCYNIEYHSSHSEM